MTGNAGSIAQSWSVEFDVGHDIRRLVVRVTVTLHIFSVVSRHIAPDRTNFCGFNFLRFMAVANFSNINSNESFCPVG